MTFKPSSRLFLTMALTLNFANSSVFAADSTPKKKDTIVAIVNNRSIYLSELEEDYNKLPKEMRENNPFAQVYLDMLQRAKEGILILEAASKEGFENDPLVKKAMEKTIIQLYILRFIEKISDAAVRQRYDTKYVKEFIKGKERKISHILLNAKTPEKEVKKIIDDLNKGTSFAKIAKEKSLDRQSAEAAGKEGEIGWVRREQLPKEMADAVFTSSLNSLVQKPVPTNFGIHIVKVSEERDAKPLAFEEIKDMLRLQIAEEELKSKLNKKANIQLFDMEGKPLRGPVEASDPTGAAV